MSADRVLLGMILCQGAVILIIFFITLGYTLTDYPELGSIEVYEAIFFFAMHPYWVATLGIWSAFAALAAGAFIGGLAAKGAKNGLLVGVVTWVLLLVLYMAITWAFDISTMMYFWQLLGLTVVLDIVIGLGILIGVGALGGMITSGGE